MVATPPKGSNQLSAAELASGVRVPQSRREALELIYAALQQSDVFYGHGTDNAWDEAVLLLLSACDLPPMSGEEVLDADMHTDAWGRATDWLLQRVEQRTPLPYLLGRAWFAGLEFHCDPRALVPRSPLAEVIQNDYLPWWRGASPSRILDLCCGGGAIGIAAAVYQPGAQVVLADIDADALALAAENRALHGLEQRVSLRESDLFSDLAGERFDIILCNPPYVDAPDLAQMPAEYHAEPPRGLGCGEDGLDLAREILVSAAEYLLDGGLLFLELGNSWQALDELLSELPLTWLEFSEGGHGVLVVESNELAAIRAVLVQDWTAADSAD
jgi:ribosomal protein L3 glutamine methyltransferase